MARPLLPDELWELIKPLIPVRGRGPKGGHPPVDDRVCLTGILFVLKTGIPWEDFPCEMGCCGMTLWNRLRDWQEAGVWQAVHETLLAELRGAHEIDFRRAVADSSSVRAVHGGKKRGSGRASPSARAPWTAGRTVRSTTWSPTPGACRWRRSSRAATATT
jgi:transposase